MTKQIPYPLLWDRMPVDISHIFEDEKPAGKHGFLKAEGDNFVFEDGTKAKFWGVCFNSNMNFPTHEHSEKVARRLAMTGVNIVRLHQLDAEWSAPNIFAFSKGKKLDNTQHLDSRSMERLDYLMYCLKQEGIYMYIDPLTFRRFRKGDGVENAHLFQEEAARPYCEFDRTLIDLQKKLNRELFNHYNPYTGLCYKDDPAIVLMEIVGESDMLDAENFPINVEPYRTQLLERFRQYAKDKGKEIVSEDLEVRRDPFLREFLFEVQVEYVREIIDDLRDIGVKIPITAMNRQSDKTAFFTNSYADYCDSHGYFYTGDQRKFRNASHVSFPSSALLRQFAPCAGDNMPFFASEWGDPWPNEFRACTPLFVAGISAFQNYAGCTQHTYRYDCTEDESITKKLGREVVLGSSYYRGRFDCYNDPAQFGLYYHAVLMMRRGDVSMANEKHVITFSEEEMFKCEGEDLLGRLIYNDTKERFIEQHMLRFGIGDYGVKEVPEAPECVLSDTGEIYRDYKKGMGWVDTPKTKAVYGATTGETKLSDVTISIKNDFATVALSSLSDAPIASSDNILLTAVGRADNTDPVYNQDHTVLAKEGRAPILIEVINATISIKTPHENMLVWGVNNEGQLIGRIPAEYKDDTLTFTIGEKFESMYYLIQTQ